MRRRKQRQECEAANLQQSGNGASNTCSFNAPTLRGILEGSGSFMNFLTVQLPGQRRPSCQSHSLISPFSECLDRDGCLRKCRLADPDDWNGALETFNAQVGQSGFRVIYSSAVKGGVSEGGVALYHKKRVCCQCYGKPAYEPKQKEASGSKKTSCPVFAWLVNIRGTATYDEIPGNPVIIPPGIYVQTIADSIHNHEPDFNQPDASSKAGQKRAAADKTALQPVKPKKEGKPVFVCVNCSNMGWVCSSVLPCASCVDLCIKCVPPAGYIPPGRPYTELAFTLLEPRALAHTQLSLWHEAYEQDLLDLDAVLMELRQWRKQSLAAQRDITYGALDDITRTLGLTALDLESKDDLMLDRSTTPGPAFMAAAAAAMQKVQESETFKMYDDGKRIVSAALFSPDLAVVACNKVTSTYGLSAQEFMTYAHQRKLLATHILASQVVPEDRHMMYKAWVQANYKEKKPFSAFMKMCSRDGQVALVHFSMKYVKFPEFPNVRSATITTIELVPLSKHLTMTPGSNVSLAAPTGLPKAALLHRDLKDRGPAPRQAVPGMACVPLPPKGYGHGSIPIPTPMHVPSPSPTPRLLDPAFQPDPTQATHVLTPPTPVAPVSPPTPFSLGGNNMMACNVPHTQESVKHVQSLSEAEVAAMYGDVLEDLVDELKPTPPPSPKAPLSPTTQLHPTQPPPHPQPQQYMPPGANTNTYTEPGPVVLQHQHQHLHQVHVHHYVHAPPVCAVPVPVPVPVPVQYTHTTGAETAQQQMGQKLPHAHVAYQWQSHAQAAPQLPGQVVQGHGQTPWGHAGTPELKQTLPPLGEYHLHQQPQQQEPYGDAGMAVPAAAQVFTDSSAYAPTPPHTHTPTYTYVQEQDQAAGVSASDMSGTELASGYESEDSFLADLDLGAPGSPLLEPV